jgi:hypothetical protein
MRGGQLAPILRDAGLDVAGMAVATPVAVDPDSPAYIHLAASVASLLPLIVAHDLATEAVRGRGREPKIRHRADPEITGFLPPHVALSIGA